MVCSAMSALPPDGEWNACPSAPRSARGFNSRCSCRAAPWQGGDVSESVFVLHTGGTIGMVDTPDGYAAVPGALEPYLDWMAESWGGELPSFPFRELAPPIDSSNATADDWCAI